MLITIKIQYPTYQKPKVPKLRIFCYSIVHTYFQQIKVTSNWPIKKF